MKPTCKECGHELNEHTNETWAMWPAWICRCATVFTADDMSGTNLRVVGLTRCSVSSEGEIMKTFEKSSVYQNPQISSETELDRLKLSKMAASVGLEIEWSAEFLFCAILNPDKNVPEAWGVLASPLTFNEAWHWLNAYAAGRVSQMHAKV